MGIGKKVKMYMNFTKFRLSALVILSALSGYLFVGGNNSLEITYLMIGGLLVTAASNGSNQIWERELDVLMNRTRKCPNKNCPGRDALHWSINKNIRYKCSQTKQHRA